MIWYDERYRQTVYVYGAMSVQELMQRDSSENSSHISKTRSKDTSFWSFYAQFADGRCSLSLDPSCSCHPHLITWWSTLIWFRVQFFQDLDVRTSFVFPCYFLFFPRARISFLMCAFDSSFHITCLRWRRYCVHQYPSFYRGVVRET